MKWSTNRRAISRKSTVTAMLMAAFLVGGSALYIVQTFASPDPTLQVQAQNIRSLGSSQIQVQVHGAAPNSSLPVAIQVTVTPTPQTPVTPSAGGPYCETVTLTTDGGGNGKVTVAYPVDSVNYPTTFAACTGHTGGPSTILGGTYAVTASTPSIATPATTSFTVQAPRHVVTGTGYLDTVSTSTFDYLSFCPGDSGTPSTSNSVFLQTTVASATLTGISGQQTVLSSNTPGQEDVSAIVNPCATNSSSIITHAVFPFDNVTVSPPGGSPITGGITLTSETTGAVGPLTPTMTMATNGMLEPTATQYTTLLSHVTIAGKGGLRGVTGVMEGQGLVTAVSCSAGSEGYTFGTVTCTSANIGASISHGLVTTVWFELDNVPGS
jgi:hypothetical protein